MSALAELFGGIDFKKRVLLFVVSLVLAVSLSISCVIASSAQLADSNSEYVEEISESKNEQEPSSNIFQPFIDFLKSVFCSKIIFDTDGGSEIE